MASANKDYDDKNKILGEIAADLTLTKTGNHSKNIIRWYLMTITVFTKQFNEIKPSYIR